MASPNPDPTNLPPGAQDRPRTSKAPRKPEAATVELTAMESLSKEDRAHIENWIDEVIRKETDARSARERQWRFGVQLFRNEYDFDGKEDWQSQLVISKVPNAVNTATGILKAGITQTEDWWDIKAPSEDPLDEAILSFLKDFFAAELAERDASHRDFLDNWLNISVKYGLVASQVVMKIYPVASTRKVRVLEALEPDEPSDIDDPARARALLAAGPEGASPQGNVARAVQGQRPVKIRSHLRDIPYTQIRKEPVDPFDYYADHTGRRLYEAQRIRGDLYELEDFPKEAGYDQAALRRVAEKADEAHDEEEQAQERRGGTTSQSISSRKTWAGVELWGGIPDKEGNLRWPDHVATVIEGVLVRLAPNPYPDGSPFRASCVEEIPFSAYGRGLVENQLGVAAGIIELVNASLDAILYEVLKAFEIDTDQVADPEELEGGIVPGKTYAKRDADKSGNPMIRPVETGTLPSDVPNLIAQLDRYFQEGTLVTELSQGLQPVRGFPTATEIGARQQSTIGGFNAIAQWLQKSSLEPSLEAIFSRMVEFKLFGEGGKAWRTKVVGAERNEEFEALILQRLMKGDDTIEVNVEFEVQGLATILARAQELDKIARVIESAKGVPGFANRIQWDHVSKRILSILGFDGENMMKPQEELDFIKELENQALAAASAQTGEQPRSNSGMGAAALGATAPSGG